MHNFFIMHMLEGTGNLSHILPNNIFLERNLIRCVLFDHFLQIPFFCPFSYNVQLIIFDERVNVFDDIGMVQGLHQINLFKTFITLFLIGHVENLDEKFDTLIFLRA